MPTYGVYWTSSPNSQATPPPASRLMDTETSWDSAVCLARLFAEDHAARLYSADHVAVAVSDLDGGEGITGATFVTTNGSRVWYTARLV